MAENLPRKARLCGHCASPATGYCLGCRCMRYCSGECQEADWTFHRELCSTWSGFIARPSQRSRRIIRLPGDLSGPQLAWMGVEDIESYLDNNECSSVPISRRPPHDVTHNKMTIYMAYCKKRSASERENRHVRRLVAAEAHVSGDAVFYGILSAPEQDDRDGKRAYGDVFFYGGLGHVKQGEDETKCTYDLDCNDFTFALDGLRNHFRNRGGAPHSPLVFGESVMGKDKKVTGVKVKLMNAGAGDESMTIEPVMIPFAHPMFDLSFGLEGAALLGLKLVVWKYRPTIPPSSREKDTGSHDTPYHDNPLQNLFMHTKGCAPALGKFHPEVRRYAHRAGEVPEGWRKIDTDLLIAHAGAAEDTTPATLRAACDFLQREVLPLLIKWRSTLEFGVPFLDNVCETKWPSYLARTLEKGALGGRG